LSYNPTTGALVKATAYAVTNSTTDPVQANKGQKIYDTLYTGSVGQELIDRRFYYSLDSVTINSTAIWDYATHMVVTYSPVDPATGALLPTSVIVSSEPFFF